jgi:dTDP-glucose 4,6-dehydratase
VKVLITGGAGFIGSHAVDHFVGAGDDVTVVDKLTYAGKMENLVNVVEKCEFKQLDICSGRDMNTVFLHGGFDVVINFAAETHVDNSINDAEPFIQTNVLGATNLMELAHHYNASTELDDALGALFHGFSTLAQLAPRNPYSATKAAADMMLLARHNTFKQPYLIFRPSNNFGPRQHKEKFLPKLLDSMLTGKDFPLYGDGCQMREWTFAPDTGRLIRDAIVAGERDKVLNISSVTRARTSR